MKNSIVMSLLMALIIVLSGYIIYKEFIYTEPSEQEKIIKLGELTGEQKLILAKQTVYREYIKKFKDNPLDYGEILIRWQTKYEFITDFKKQHIDIRKNGNTLKVICPQIELNDPQIDLSVYNHLILNDSLFKNLNKIINQENRTLQGRAVEFGQTLLRDSDVQKICTNEMKLFILSLAQKLNLKFENIEIEFI